MAERQLCGLSSPLRARSTEHARLSLVVADVGWDTHAVFIRLQHGGGHLAVAAIGTAGAIWVELSQDLGLFGCPLVLTKFRVSRHLVKGRAHFVRAEGIVQDLNFIGTKINLSNTKADVTDRLH